VPPEIFEGFQEINVDNELEFEYIATGVVIAYIESCLLNNYEKDENSEETRD
jgi:hypothetical protein